MKSNNINPNKTDQDEKFVLVSSRTITRLEEKLSEIHDFLLNTDSKTGQLPGYVSEKQAMELFNRSHTWFWEKRKSGELKCSKIGRTIYYKQEDLLALVENDANSGGLS